VPPAKNYRRGDEIFICIRPHHVSLAPSSSEADPSERKNYNQFSGIIKRRIYFGDSIDYVVELSDQLTLRVVAPPSERYDLGQKIVALALPEHCVIVGEK
jgi:ABC-type Fe3+/spermidine/putrescine transport system ATPase subunit